jgi:hypothetical protein
MDSHEEYLKHRKEERTMKRKKLDKVALIVSVTSTTIGILLLAIGIGGYLANTELIIEPDDLYGGIGFAGGMVLIFGNLVAIGIKWV